MYTADVMQQSKQALARFYTALRFLSAADPIENTDFEMQFKTAMDDDFNTPVALSALFELAHEIQRLRDKGEEERAARHGALLKELGGVLGILQTDPNAFFQTGHEVNAEKINVLITARQQARQERNWAEADRIRQELTEMKVVIEDGAAGTTWKYVG